MFKLKITQKQEIPRKGDVIVCTLEEVKDDQFYVTRVLNNGVILGRYIDNFISKRYEYPWIYGNNYAILRSN